MHNTNTRSPTPNRYYNEHYSRNPRNSSRSVTPHRNTSNSQSPSSYKRNQSPTINQIADNLEEVFQAASLDNTMTDEQFLNFCNYFDVGILESINTLDGTTKPGSRWYIPLNVPFKKPTEKSEAKLLQIEFSLDTGATINILNTPTWNAIKTHLHQCKNE